MQECRNGCDVFFLNIFYKPRGKLAHNPDCSYTETASKTVGWQNELEQVIKIKRGVLFVPYKHKKISLSKLLLKKNLMKLRSKI